jgi:hypothetical protein
MVAPAAWSVSRGWSASLFTSVDTRRHSRRFPAHEVQFTQILGRTQYIIDTSNCPAAHRGTTGGETSEVSKASDDMEIHRRVTGRTGTKKANFATASGQVDELRRQQESTASRGFGSEEGDDGLLVA